MKRWTWPILAILAMPVRAQQDPEAILAAALDSESVEDRLLSVRALVDLGRREPLLARRESLLADPNPYIQCEALVALGDPEDATAAVLAIANIPGKRPEVLDARAVLAALLASVDPQREALVRECAKGFPEAPKKFDYWLTGDAAIHLFESFPPIVADLLRPQAMALLRGEDRPGLTAIARALTKFGDPSFLDALRERTEGEPGKDRYEACMLLFENELAGEDDRALLLEKAWEDASREGFWTDDQRMFPAYHLVRLTRAGAPKAADTLGAFIREHDDLFAPMEWIALAAPIESVRRDWSRAREDVEAYPYFARALLRSGAEEDRTRVFEAFGDRFNWEVLDAIEEARPTESEREWIGKILKAHFAKGNLPGDSPMDRGKSFLLGHRYGLPGMIERAAAMHPYRDHLAALYDLGAKEEARRMARKILENVGASWEEEALREKVGVAAQLAGNDPETARELLAPLVDEDLDKPTLAGALAYQFDANEETQLLRAAAATLLAREGSKEALALLEALRDQTIGWRRYRSVAWSRGLFAREEEITCLTELMGQTDHLDDIRSWVEMPGYRSIPTTAEETTLLATNLLLLDPSNARAADAIRSHLNSVEGRTRREAVRALSVLGAVTVDPAGDAVVSALVEWSRARAGDVEARRNLESRLASNGADRIVAAHAILSLGR